MKIRNIALVLIMALLLSTFSGCGLRQVEQRLDAVEDKLENKADGVEDIVENVVESAVYGTPEVKAPKSDKPPQEVPVSKDFEPELTASHAEGIALRYAGVCVADVSLIRSEYEIDDGVKKYDVNFYLNNVEYEYEIHADSGEIISFDVDRD